MGPFLFEFGGASSCRAACLGRCCFELVRLGAREASARILTTFDEDELLKFSKTDIAMHQHQETGRGAKTRVSDIFNNRYEK